MDSLNNIYVQPMKTAMSFLIFMLMAFQVSAFTPESGQYWDPEEPGTGYAIEIQDNYLYMTFYVFDEYGYPVWYASGGFLDGNSSYEGLLAYFTDGQCLGCYWQESSGEDSGYGHVEIEFLTETTAELTILGVTKTIERFNFFLGDELQKMRGEWQVVSDMTAFEDFTGYPFFADILIFEQTEIYDGTYMATGCRAESTYYFYQCTNNANFYNSVAATYYEELGLTLIIVDQDDTHFLAYVAEVGTDQFDGAGYRYRKDYEFDPIDEYLYGSEPIYVVRGFRSASKTFVQTGSGPSKAKPNISSKPKLDRTAKLNLPEVSADNMIKNSEDTKESLKIVNKLERYLLSKQKSYKK